MPHVSAWTFESSREAPSAADTLLPEQHSSRRDPLSGSRTLNGRVGRAIDGASNARSVDHVCDMADTLR